MPAALVDDWKTILVGAVAIVGSLIAIFRSGLKSIRSICGRARRRTGLKYLPENDIGLMTAIEGIATTSAWARWYAAKLLTINERCLLPRASIFRSVASELARALRDGKLRSGASLCQLVQLRLRLLQIERVEAFGEPAVDRSEQLAGL